MLELVRWYSSTYPNPTNAQALAALDAFVWDSTSAADATAHGVSDAIAQGFFPPDGILPRMRLLAWGWTKAGDKFKSPSDTSWWKRAYQYPLWQPIETLADQLERADDALPGWLWNEELAAGDVAELSRSLPAVVQEDLPPVNEAPCPRWLIPPGRGQSPIANPECLRKPARDELEKVIPKLPAPTDYSWLLWIGLIYLIMEDDR